MFSCLYLQNKTFSLFVPCTMSFGNTVWYVQYGHAKKAYLNLSNNFVFPMRLRSLKKRHYINTTI